MAAPAGTTLIAIGNFDGVHRGHRAMLHRACGVARERGLEPHVLTFDPHPVEVLGLGKRERLTTLDRKIELLCRMDPALRVVVEQFTPELSRMTPRQFCEEVLVGQLGAGKVIVGANFRFGHGRAGDLDTLRELGAELGFDAGAEPMVGDDAGKFSSTRARDALSKADLPSVERVLGRPHSVSGEVVEGDRRGRTIGFPTANLSGVAEALPPYGVYACVVDEQTAEGARMLARGVANIGVRPTVDAGFSVEVHLFDTERDLYGARLRVHLTDHIRPERKFAGVDELVAQIRTDAAAARELVAEREPDDEADGAWY